jgi:hypothetical protein
MKLALAEARRHPLVVFLVHHWQLDLLELKKLNRN